MKENIANDLRTVTQKVEWLLERHPAARDSDKVLYIEYLRRYTPLGINLFYTIGEIGECIMADDVPTPETISRKRRRIQQEGRWIGTRHDDRAEEADGVKDWAING